MTNISLNLAARLTQQAYARPDAVAVAEPRGYDRRGKRRYRSLTFRELDEDSGRIAWGLREWGVPQGARLALLVRPGIDFIALVFGLLKAGTVVVLIDPGMGRGNLLQCLADAEPDGFVAIPIVHAMRMLFRARFPKAKWNVTVGRRWFWGGKTLKQLREAHTGEGEAPAEPREKSKLFAPLTARQEPRPPEIASPFLAPTMADDPAAIIFTTGSTGLPKGVLFTHRTFDAQVSEIQNFYGIQAGEIDLPCFPMFGLFNCMMGVTTVIPDMDPTRPALVDPRKILEAAGDWNITQAFGSPAVWNRVGQYCEERRLRLPTLRRVLSAGAPVPAEVLRRMKNCIHPEGEIHTPYGATEALPVASISACERLAETDGQTREGAGVCVGRKFPGIAWKVIRIVEGPIDGFDEIEELPPGEIGELIVSGAQVSRRYVTRIEANQTGKILDGNAVWHRMGDAGYFDAQNRFWFCGRVAHRVLTPHGPLYPIRCEAIFNRHTDVFRSALVGIGPAGERRPIVILEPEPGKMPKTPEAKKTFLEEICKLAESSPLTASIRDFLFHPAFPVDIRHNAKIFREKLAVWAEEAISR
jgi:acyl-CoA synthetase (AMP-forming)/AMP-acid ligase II